MFTFRPSDYEDNAVEEVDKNTDEEAEERLITIFLNLFASTSSDFISKRKVSICCYLLEFSHKKLTMLWGAQGKAKRWHQKVMIFYNFFNKFLGHQIMKTVLWK